MVGNIQGIVAFTLYSLVPEVSYFPEIKGHNAHDMGVSYRTIQ